MKKFLILSITAAIALFSSISLSAQGKFGPDSAECIKYLSYYTEYYKQKNYDSALPNWRKAYKLCPPTARYSMLSDGTTLIRRLISKNSKNVIYKNELVDSLMTLYDQRVEFWPKYKVQSLNNKALDMYNYMKDDPERLLKGLSEIVESNKGKTKPNIFLFQFSTACDLYKDGMIDAEQVIEIYETSVSYLEGITAKNDYEKKTIDKTKTDIESLFIQSNVASCDNLIALFTPRFEANPSDVALAANVVKMMGRAEECTDNELFLNAITLVHKSEPSYTSAYYLYKLHSSKGNFEEAVNYMIESISYDESDSVADAGYYYELATYTLKNNKRADAYKYAQKALELDESIAGKAYMLMGTIWGSLACPGNEIEKRAPYWVAVDFLIKARNADATLADEANALIGQYSAYYPQAADAFMYNVVEGDPYTVSCAGMSARTTVRTQK